MENDSVILKRISETGVLEKGDAIRLIEIAKRLEDYETQCRNDSEK